jgi:insertion element IS1 protein InsB
LDKVSSKVVAYTFGTRADSTLNSLLEKLKGFKITLYFTDGWGSYERLLDPRKHIVGKRYTQKIERCNLNFRTRVKRLARKTICFSKSSEIHDKVIGTLIEKIAF